MLSLKYPPAQENGQMMDIDALIRKRMRMSRGTFRTLQILVTTWTGDISAVLILGWKDPRRTRTQTYLILLTVLTADRGYVTKEEREKGFMG